MNLWQLMQPSEDPVAASGRLYGVVVGIVTNNQDPEKLGRIKVKFPWLADDAERSWARVVSPMAGKERGMVFLPEVDDEVLVVFEHGDVNRPYILGALWNGVDLPPETNSDGKNNLRLIKSRSGHKIVLDDTEDAEKIAILDASEKNSITLDTKTNAITIVSEQDVVIKAPKGKISLDCKELELKSSAAAKVESGAGLDLKASGNLNVKGATINLN
jgi:uncharacterized protein involved in type VI secretion and phage assembly